MLDVPAAWSDKDGSSWSVADKNVGVQITAAPSVTDWQNGFDTNGIFVGASRQLVRQYTPEQWLDNNLFTKTCKSSVRKSYKTANWTGAADNYSQYGDNGALLTQIAALSPDKSVFLVIQIIAAQQEDVKLWDQILYDIDTSKVP